MKKGLSEKFIGAVAVTLILFQVLLFLMRYNMLLKFEKHTAWKDHTYEVLLQSNELLTALDDAETGQRGFIITSDDKFLQPFTGARVKSSLILESLKELTIDNVTQQSRVDSLIHLIEKRFSNLNEGIYLEQQQKKVNAIELVQSGVGRHFMDSIRTLLSDFKTAEEKLLKERSELLERNMSDSSIVLITGTTLVFSAVIFLFILLFKENRRRKSSEKELFNSRESYSKTMISMGDGVISTNGNLEIIFMNKAAEQLTGWDLAEAAGKSIDIVFEIISEKTKLPVPNPIRKALLENKVVLLTNHTILIRRDKSEIFIDDSAAPILDDEGKLTGGVLIFRDISDKKKTESALVQLNKDLEWKVEERTTELLKSELHYKQTLDVMMEGVQIIDFDWKYVYVNDAVTVHGRKKRSELLGHTMMEIYPGFEKSEAFKVMQQSMIHRTSHQIENEFTYPDLSKACFELSIQPVPNGIFILSLDITERKAIEENLRQTENRFRALIEKSNDMVTLRNEAGRMFYVSPSVLTVLGYSLDEILNAKAIDFIHPDDLPGYLKKIQTILKTPGSFFSSQQRYRHKNGNWIWGEGTVTNMLHEPGINAFVTNFRDISERKAGEGNLKQSESRLKEAQALSKICNWEIDLQTNISTWSDEFYNIFSVKRDTVKPSASVFLEFAHPDDYNFVKEKMDTSFSRFANVGFNSRIITKEGTLKYIYTESRYEFDRNRKPIRIYGTFHDVTENKLAEQEREKITADIFQRNKDLEQFSYIVSHNLRAPIANIIGLNDLIKSETISAKQKEMCGRELSKSVGKLDEVINDLNDILQVKNHLNEKRETIALDELTKDIFLSIRNLVEKEHVTFMLDFNEVKTIRTIRTYIYSIFYNLISNSIKYRSRTTDPQIEISSKRVNEKIILSFKDNGLGIDLKARGEQVFGLYKRFHTEDAEGKGMGLYMVKTQVESLGGKISVTSKPGNGTTFTIEFPEARDREIETSDN